jgi:hypothetical protein
MINSGFNQAWSDKDISKVSEFISDNFLSSGLTKNRILEIFTMSASYLSESKIILIAHVEGKGGQDV